MADKNRFDDAMGFRITRPAKWILGVSLGASLLVVVIYTVALVLND